MYFTIKSLAIIFTLEQPTYTIIESNNTLTVCVDLIQGQLAREVFFNLSYQHISTEGKLNDVYDT